jgi:hypothetical protein
VTAAFGAAAFTSVGPGPPGSSTELTKISSPSSMPPVIVKYLSKLGIMGLHRGLD